MKCDSCKNNTSERFCKTVRFGKKLKKFCARCFKKYEEHQAYLDQRISFMGKELLKEKGRRGRTVYHDGLCQTFAEIMEEHARESA